MISMSITYFKNPLIHSDHLAADLRNVIITDFKMESLLYLIYTFLLFFIIYIMNRHFV